MMITSHTQPLAVSVIQTKFTNHYAIFIHSHVFVVVKQLFQSSKHSTVHTLSVTIFPPNWTSENISVWRWTIGWQSCALQRIGQKLKQYWLPDDFCYSFTVREYMWCCVCVCNSILSPQRVERYMDEVCDAHTHTHNRCETIKIEMKNHSHSWATRPSQSEGRIRCDFKLFLHANYNWSHSVVFFMWKLLPTRLLYRSSISPYGSRHDNGARGSFLFAIILTVNTRTQTHSTEHVNAAAAAPTIITWSRVADKNLF